MKSLDRIRRLVSNLQMNIVDRRKLGVRRCRAAFASLDWRGTSSANRMGRNLEMESQF
jgi:hypothetical protein